MLTNHVPFSPYVFDEGIHQMRLDRERKRRRYLAEQIVRDLREYVMLPYEAVDIVERRLALCETAKGVR